MLCKTLIAAETVNYTTVALALPPYFDVRNMKLAKAVASIDTTQEEHAYRRAAHHLGIQVDLLKAAMEDPSNSFTFKSARERTDDAALLKLVHRIDTDDSQLTEALKSFNCDALRNQLRESCVRLDGMVDVTFNDDLEAKKTTDAEAKPTDTEAKPTDAQYKDQLKYNKMFKVLDKDQDGKVTMEEMKEGLKKFAPEVVEAIFKDMDQDKDGLVAIEELARHMAANPLPDQPARAPQPSSDEASVGVAPEK